jgi:hypothetical protein
MKSSLAALLVFAAAIPARAAGAERLKISGRVTFGGHRLPAGRKVRVQISREFPGDGGQADKQVAVSGSGRFALDRVPPGDWWLAAWIDDDGDGRLSPGREITGYSTINPVQVGGGRSSFAAVIDLDPILVTVVTRFEPASGATPSRRVLESLRVIPLDPWTAHLLTDARVRVGDRDLRFSASDGCFLLAPATPEDALGRYVVEVLHPAYGRAPRRRSIAPRAFGAVPEARIVGTRVEWTSPPWANFATVTASLKDGRILYDRSARSPLELAELAAGATVRVRLGRVDVQHAGDVAIATGDVLLKVPAAPSGDMPALPAASIHGGGADAGASQSGRSGGQEAGSRR